MLCVVRCMLPPVLPRTSVPTSHCTACGLPTLGNMRLPRTGTCALPRTRNRACVCACVVRLRAFKHLVLCVEKLEVVAPERHVAGLGLVRMRQVRGRPTRQRHIRVGHRALERQQRRHRVRMRWEPRSKRVCCESQMIVSMWLLRVTARLHDVHLRRHLIARTEP